MSSSDWSSDVCSSDLNGAPLENDVWNHKRLRRSVGHTPLEAERMKDFWAAGELIDVPRHFVPEPEPLYTWWGYRFPQSYAKIGRAHVCTPATNAHLVCRLLLDKQNTLIYIQTYHTSTL